jgi:hypothetical protein
MGMTPLYVPVNTALNALSIMINTTAETPPVNSESYWNLAK